MSHGMRWPSENAVLGTTARIVDTFSKSGGVESRHAPGTGTSPASTEGRMDGSENLPGKRDPASKLRLPSAGVAPGPLTPNDGSRPNATGKYPPVIYPLVGLCKAAGLPAPIPEYEFHQTRKWRFDYAIPQWKVAIEIEGGIWRQGGGAHSHPSNIMRDIAKYNAAAVQGWRILRYMPEDLMDAVNDLRAL